LLNKPTLRDLMRNIDSKYTLVIIAAKRARALVDDNPELMNASTVNPVSMALEDIAEARITWTEEADEAI